MRFQVPQFVDIEDKIIGPFTLKQFLIYFGTVLSLIPIFLASDLSLFLTIALPALGIAAAFAHLKINGKTLAQVLVSAVKFYLSGQLYIWRRDGKTRQMKVTGEEWEEQIVSAGGVQPSLTALGSVAQSLETEGNIISSEDIEDPLDTEAEIQKPDIKGTASKIEKPNAAKVNKKVSDQE